MNLGNQGNRLLIPNKFMRGYEETIGATPSNQDLEQEKLMFNLTLSLSIVVASLFLLMTVTMIVMLLCLPRMAVVRHGFKMLKQTMRTDRDIDDDDDLSVSGVSSRCSMAAGRSALSVTTCEHCGRPANRVDPLAKSSSKMKNSKSYGAVLGYQLLTPTEMYKIKKSNTGGSLRQIVTGKRSLHRSNSRIDLVPNDKDEGTSNDEWKTEVV